MTSIVLSMVGVLLISPWLATQTSSPVWEWSFPQIQTVVEKVRAGGDLTPKPWPHGARVAVALSFDFDAESGFLVSGNDSAQPLSRGEYGPRVGVPRILQMAEKYKVPLTFFIPAIDGQLHPDAIDAILKSPLKHEIGIHGWIHEPISHLKPGRERGLTMRASEWWTQRLGQQPAGIRTPCWDFTGDTLATIRDLGFAYDTSLIADDRPYEIVAERKPTGQPTDFSNEAQQFSRKQRILLGGGHKGVKYRSTECVSPRRAASWMD
jgi:peptidoglycan/xylan/chitin deacetylase (PgdA/CDA1 family)